MSTTTTDARAGRPASSIGEPDRSCGPEELLACWHPGALIFASGRGLLYADRLSPLGWSAEQIDHDHLRRLRDAPAVDGGRPIIVGALPFDRQAPSTLALAGRIFRTSALPRIPVQQAIPVDQGWMLSASPTARSYARAVQHAVGRLQAGDLAKVVLARTVRYTAPFDIDVAAVVRRLAGRDPHAYSFAAPAGAGRTLIGASPELLVSRTGRAVRSHPLAGSAARSQDPVEDRRRAEELLHSRKNLREHALVVDAVVEALRPYCRRLDVPDGPALTSTATMWHLGTEISGELADPEVGSLQLATALHPTPAVCGTPSAEAREAIGRLEPFDRELYAGAIGWSDEHGDGEWAVTLRCGLVEGRSMRLYAGAGIVADSDPAAELAETRAKLGTMRRAAGLPDDADHDQEV